MRGKTKYLWGKDATGGLKPESHPRNYKYRRKHIFIMHGNGGGERLASLYRHTILRERNSNLRVPFLNVSEVLDEALDSGKDVFVTSN